MTAPSPAMPAGTYPHLDLHPRPDLHQRLSELRGHGPVVRVALHNRVPAWLVSGAADVESALTDPRLSSNDRWLHPGGGGAGRSTVKVSLMGLDGPEHMRLRRILARPFTPRSVDGLRPRVQALTDELVDRLKRQPAADLVQDLALPLPLHVICDVLGVPQTNRDDVHRLAQRLLDPSTDPRVREQLRGRLGNLIDVQDTPADGATFTSTLLRDSALTARETVDASVLLLIAGYETTAKLIGSILLWLLERPARYRALTRDPSLIPAVVDELLRLQGPVTLGVTRYSTTDVTISGTLIPAGQRVLLSLGAADRDPRRWPHPDSYDLARSPGGRSLAFGHGPHFCLGAHLARLEAQTVLAVLARRIPRLALAEPARSLGRQAGIFHGPALLPVWVDPVPRHARSRREARSPGKV
ncbi:cytochrome P450 [Streptomyces sp. NPDC058371]|uniref:cytochrome P450 n=1 Tax=Streptomyces sp. NPDC058371 TaxID=3346463 RepID=UPI00364D69A7